MENEANKNPTAPQAVTPPTAQVSQNPGTSLFSKIPHPKIILPVIVLVIVIIGIAYFLVVAQRNQSNELQAQIYSNMQAGNFLAAENLAKKGLEKNPNNSVLTRNIIDAISSEGNQTGKEEEAFTKAQPYIENVLRNNSNNRNTLLSVGYAYEVAGEYEKALSYYDKALVLDPNYAPTYFHRGHVLAFLNKFSESQAMYEKAYELDPNDGLILIAKANQVGLSGDIKGAILLYIKAASNPNNSSDVRSGAFATLASIELTKGDYNKSLEYAKKAVDIDKNSAFALGIYGFDLAQLGDSKSGVRYLEQAIAQNPRMTINYIFLAVIMRGNNEFDQATALLQNALSRVETDNTILGPHMKEGRTTKILYSTL